MTKQITLMVNELPINLDYFVQGFIDHTSTGMVMGLEGTPKAKDQIENLDILIDGEKVNVNLNSNPVPTNAFASKIIKSTILGMIAPLKGVGNPDRIEIHMKV
jgi:hypothetical protein